MVRAKPQSQRAGKPSLQNFRKGPGDFDPNQSKVKRLTDWDQDDILEEEDEFFEGLDRVSLQPTSREARYENDLDIAEQVLDVDEGEDEDEVNFDDPEEDEDVDESRVKKQRKLKKNIDNSRKGRFGKLYPADVQSDSTDSDEGTVDEQTRASLKLDERGSEQEVDDDHKSSEDDESTWKSYHVFKSKSKKKKKSHEPAVLAEEAERSALELEEVKRLQIKARSKLIPADFLSYLDYASDDELQATTDNTQKSDQIAPLSASSLPKEFHSEPEAVAYLLKTKPECLALLNDFRRSLISLSEVQPKALSLDDPPGSNSGRNEYRRAVDVLNYHILSSYVSTTAFYMSLSLKTSATDPALLASVTKALINLRDTLNLMERAGLIGDVLTDEQRIILAGSDDSNGQFSSSELDQELRYLLNDQLESDIIIKTSRPEVARAKRRKSTEDSADLSSQDEESVSELKSKERGRKRRKKDSSDPQIEVEDPNVSLRNLPPRPSKLIKTPENLPEDHDFVEPTSLSAKEASDKENKKKTLRFYTAQIDAKGKRREKALLGAGLINGDTDLPYISKESQRREFLKQQDHTRSDMGDEFGQLDEQDQSQSFEEGGESNYYDTIKELKLAAKKAKQAQYDKQKLAERDALMAERDSGEQAGPREISRQILKNKGLTPKRAKENRNPRVKKRKRFDAAQKKIASQRPTFKPDQAGANRQLNGYQGEKSGVKVGVVKSRKL